MLPTLKTTWTWGGALIAPEMVSGPLKCPPFWDGPKILMDPEIVDPAPEPRITPVPATPTFVVSVMGLEIVTPDPNASAEAP
jgi:hypothetical protein